MDCLRAFVISCLTLVCFAANAATWYVKPTASGTGSGATIANAIAAADINSSCASGDVIHLVGGFGNFPSLVFTKHFLYIDSVNSSGTYTKWLATIAGSPASHGLYGLDNYHTNTVIGIHITNSYISGIKMNGHGWVIGECWIQGAGQGDPAWDHGGTYTGQGIESHNWSGHTITNNLIEGNGAKRNLDHGMYISGTNSLVQNNVVRNNECWGIQLYDGTGDTTGNIIRGNLVYGNGGIAASPGGAFVNYMYSSAKTNYVYGNTFIGGRDCVNISGPGNIYLRNNILFAGSGYQTIATNGLSSTADTDYNWVNQNLAGDPDGSHDVLTSTYTVATFFPNSSLGRYYLYTSAPAVGTALTTVYVPSDYYGSALTSWPDIGAFRYDPYLASSTTNLSTAGSDYWTYPNFIVVNGLGISSVTSSLVSSNTARISWATTQSSTSLVTVNGSAGTVDTNLVRFHSISLTGLTPSTTYSYTVTSTNTVNAVTSATNSFTTVAVGYTTVSTNRFFGGGL